MFKKRNLLISTHQQLLISAKTPKQKQLDPSRRVMEILECFLKEKEEYEQAINSEREQMRKAYENTMQHKNEQIRQLAETIGDLQKQLVGSREEVSKLRISLHESEREICELKRKLDSTCIRNIVDRGVKNNSKKYVRENSRQSSFLKQKPLFGNNTVKFTDSLFSKLLNNVHISQTLQGSQINVKESQQIKKCESNRYMNVKDKENINKKKSSSSDKLAGVPSSRTSLPVNSIGKGKKANDIAPFRECILNSLKTIKRLSIS